MLSAYAAPTAPTSASARPHCRMASSRSVALAFRWMARGSRSVAADSATHHTAALDGGDHLVDRRVADVDVERDDDDVRRGTAGAGGQPGVADDDVRVGRDGVHGGVLHRHRLLLQRLAQLAGE